ncbi:DMT family transporter [Pseudomonas cichorii]|uniref:DMT family transporter n=1 Tax=Pseudomonas cichorii TaxID=36746 RepID=UPI000F004CC5|nr:DMT family transporter [Pseudomonas cichorii]
MFGKVALLASIPVALGFLAGAAIPFQAVSNGALGRELGHPLWAALVSLFVSAISLIMILALLRIPLPAIGNAIQGPWWLWVGGLGGALYVAMAATLTPRVGAASFILYVMIGQVIAAMLIDHFGLMGLVPKPLNSVRMMGVALIIVGLVVVQMGAVTTQPAADSSRQNIGAATSMPD